MLVSLLRQQQQQQSQRPGVVPARLLHDLLLPAVGAPVPAGEPRTKGRPRAGKREETLAR